MRIRIVKRKAALKIPANLADVIIALSAVPSLSDKRRRDLVSACSSTARLAGRDTSELPAKVTDLRNLLAGQHHVQGRITAKRRANIRSDLAAALVAVGVIPSLDPSTELSLSWVTFLGKATAKHHALFLSRFARFCSLRQIDPSAVNDTVLKQFESYLELRILTNDPRKIVRDTAKSFNVIIKRAALDHALLKTARGERYVSTPLDAYPASLQADIERYIRRLEKPDLFSDEGPSRALRPMSLRNTKAHLRQILAAAVAAGTAPDHFKSLADLIDIEVLESAFTQITDRRRGQMPTSLANILATLLAIARHYVKAPEAIIRKLAKAKQQVGDRLGNTHRVMSKKSQRRMEQFSDEDNVALIVALPQTLIARANRKSGSSRAALDAMTAAGIAFLLGCPALRIANLAGLRMEEDLTRDGKNRHVAFHIHIAAEKTKGRQSIQARLTPPLSTVIDHYLKHHRKHLTGDPEDWVFPSQGGGPRSPGHLGDFLKQRIFKETGIVMNAHLFRHLSAFLYLHDRPGEYESVRRLVGHAKIETTTSFYSPQSNQASFDRYGEVLDRYRRDK